MRKLAFISTLLFTAISVNYGQGGGNINSGAVASVTGTGTVSCSPTTGSVVCTGTGGAPTLDAVLNPVASASFTFPSTDKMSLIFGAAGGQLLIKNGADFTTCNDATTNYSLALGNAAATQTADLGILLDGDFCIGAPISSTIHVGNNNYVDLSYGFQVGYPGTLVAYNNGTGTVRNGMPAEYKLSDLVSQTAAITATTIYSNIPYSGVYRLCYNADITTASDGTSTLGGSNGFQVIFTSPTDSVVKTTIADTLSTSTANTTGTAIANCMAVYAQASTNIQYTFGYTNVDTSTAMAYELHITVEGM